MEDRPLDISSFQQWAIGNLVENRNRGIFAEWLVGQALPQALDGHEFRREWDPWDLQYRRARIEVKASGRSQSWDPLRPSKPSFGVAAPGQIWCEKTKKWQQNDQGTRPAHVYVFCLHKPVPATNTDVVDPASWDFWVLPAQVLDDELGEQKTVRPTRLDGLAKRIGSGRLEWSEIKPAVDRLIDSRRR